VSSLSDVGTGKGKLTKDGDGPHLTIKSIKAGTGITVVNKLDYVRISSSGFTPAFFYGYYELETTVSAFTPILYVAGDSAGITISSGIITIAEAGTYLFTGTIGTSTAGEIDVIVGGVGLSSRRFGTSTVDKSQWSFSGVFNSGIGTSFEVVPHNSSLTLDFLISGVTSSVTLVRIA